MRTSTSDTPLSIRFMSTLYIFFDAYPTTRCTKRLFLKNAEDIMNGENIGEEEKEFISIIAILHDIGAVEAQKKYGSIDGVYQEKEGPAVAKEILKKVGYNKNIDRICFIIGNHHTPSKINGLDFQIQWEADLLENLMVMDKEKEQEKIKKCIGENFKTNTGKRIAYNRFILD